MNSEFGPIEYYWISFKADRYAKCRFTTITYTRMGDVDVPEEDRPRTKKDIIKRAKRFLIDWYNRHGYTTTNTVEDGELVFTSKGLKDTKVSAFKCVRGGYTEAERGGN